MDTAQSDVTTAQQAATSLGLPLVRLDPVSIAATALAVVPEKLAREYRVMPVRLDTATRTLVIAVADPSLLAQPAPAFLQQLKHDGYQLEIEITPPSDFERALGAYSAQKPEVQLPSTSIPTPVQAVPSSPKKTEASPMNPPLSQRGVGGDLSAAQPIAAAPSIPTTPVNPPQPSFSKGGSQVTSPTATMQASNQAPKPLPVSAPPPASTAPAQAPAAVPAVSLAGLVISPSVLARFPLDVARKYKMVVYKVSEDGKTASVGAVDPSDRRVREILKFVEERNGLAIELGKISQTDLELALTGYEQESRSQKPEDGGTAPSAATKVPKVPDTKARMSSEKSLTPDPLPLTPPSKTAASNTSSSDSPKTAPAVSPKPELKLASNDAIKAAVAKPQAVIPPAPAVSTAAPVVPPVKVGGVTAIQPPQPVPVQDAGVRSKELGVRGDDASRLTPHASPDLVSSQTLTQPSQPPAGDERNLDSMLGSPIKDAAQLEQVVKAGMVPKIVAAILSLAVNSSASDIHLEAARDHVRIRFRIDGELVEIIRLPIELLAPLVSRIKILAKLKIDESRIPQDGRFDVWLEGREIDLRVSTLPTMFGEKVVLRILDKSAGVKSLEELGVSGSALERLRGVIDDPYGIVLVSGPTGSGKTSTLYALLAELNRDGVNIVTLEDPVEYQLEGINQTQVKPAIGFGFADGLRSILRQDPNIIMVGEIRDQETAALATQAALTGHLVLSTLHTNDAAGAIPRMIDMGVEPFLLASSLKAVIGQRLVRRLSPEAAQPATVAPAVVAELKQDLASSKDPAVQQAATGPMQFKAPQNGRASYHGRVGIYEVLTMSDAIATLTLKKAVASDIQTQALEEGMVTMRQDGVLKALAGTTSLEEVLTVTADR